MKRATKKLLEKINFPALIIFTYLLIVFQGFFTVSIIPSVFRINLITNIEPSYLLLWGALRILVILPLVYMLFVRSKNALKKIFYNLENFNRTMRITFWTTFLFVILGFLFYQYFLNQSAITPDKFITYFPYFILFSISNSFVEETFFRGFLLSSLSEKWGPDIGNNVQALLFALIHLPVIAFNPNAVYFILITFVLGYIWGALTLNTKSIFPAIIFHTVADIFFVISLF